jgi:hypothetical protein
MCRQPYLFGLRPRRTTGRPPRLSVSVSAQDQLGRLGGTSWVLERADADRVAVLSGRKVEEDPPMKLRLPRFAETMRASERVGTLLADAVDGGPPPDRGTSHTP